MTEPSLELLLEHQRRIIDDLRDIRATVGRIEHELMQQRQDMGSLARVMLRFESRVSALEEARAP
jgi:hypothetical protein